MTHRYQDHCARWPQHNGYREVERMANVALMPADEVPDDTVRWLWPSTIPLGHLTIVAGEPASGKSFWMYDLAARVTFARPWPYRHHASRGGSPHATREARIDGENYENTKSESPKKDTATSGRILLLMEI